GGRLAISLPASMNETSKRVVRVWDGTDGHELCTLTPQMPDNGRSIRLRLSPRGDTVLTGGMDSFQASPQMSSPAVDRTRINTTFVSVLQAWNATTGELQWQTRSSASLVRFSPDGEQVIGLLQPGLQPHNMSGPPAVVVWD